MEAPGEEGSWRSSPSNPHHPGQKLSVQPSLFFLKGAKEPGRVFRFALPSSWLSKLEVVGVCDISEYANLRSQEIKGRGRTWTLATDSEWVLGISRELCALFLFSLSSIREENFLSKHTQTETFTPQANTRKTAKTRLCWHERLWCSEPESLPAGSRQQGSVKGLYLDKHLSPPRVRKTYQCQPALWMHPISQTTLSPNAAQQKCWFKLFVLMWVWDKVLWFLACWQEAVNDVVMVYIYPSLDAQEERQDCEITAGPCHVLPCWVRQTHTGLCPGLSGEVARQAPGVQKNPQAPPRRLCGDYQEEGILSSL